MSILCFIQQVINRFVFLQEDAVLAGSAGHRLQTGLKHYDLSKRRDQDDFIAGQNLKQLMKYRDDPTLLEVYSLYSLFKWPMQKVQFKVNFKIIKRIRNCLCTG